LNKKGNVTVKRIRANIAAVESQGTLHISSLSLEPLSIQNAMRLRLIVISCLSSSAAFFRTISKLARFPKERFWT
jgi:hypothetical protein